MLTPEEFAQIEQMATVKGTKVAAVLAFIKEKYIQVPVTGNISRDPRSYTVPSSAKTMTPDEDKKRHIKIFTAKESELGQKPRRT